MSHTKRSLLGGIRVERQSRLEVGTRSERDLSDEHLVTRIFGRRSPGEAGGGEVRTPGSEELLVNDQVIDRDDPRPRIDGLSFTRQGESAREQLRELAEGFDGEGGGKDEPVPVRREAPLMTGDALDRDRVISRDEREHSIEEE